MASAQFEVVVDQPFGNVPKSVLEDTDSTVIISNVILDYVSDTTTTQLIKFNHNTGQVEKTQFLYTNKFNRFTRIDKLRDDKYFAFGSVESDTSDTYHFGVVIFNSNLDILFKKEYYLPLSDPTKYMFSYKNQDDNFIVGGFISTNNPDNYQSFLFEIDENGDSIRSTIIEKKSVLWDITRKKGTNTYYLFMFGYDWALSILEIDEEFNITHWQKIATNFVLYHTVKWVNDTEFYLTGAYHFDNEDDIKIMKLDTSYTTLLEKSFGTPQVFDYPASDQNLDFIDINNVYYAGTSNASWLHPWSAEPSHIMLNKLDANLDLKWQRFYGDDISYYWACNVIATDDGGCLMFNTIGDLENGEEYNVHIIKVDSLGNYTPTGIENQPQITATELVTYPNPGNHLKIRASLPHTNTFFEMYDINGRMILRKQITQSETEFNMSKQSAGVYFYRYLRKGKLVESGKWVKQ